MVPGVNSAKSGQVTVSSQEANPFFINLDTVRAVVILVKLAISLRSFDYFPHSYFPVTPSRMHQHCAVSLGG